MCRFIVQGMWVRAESLDPRCAKYFVQVMWVEMAVCAGSTFPERPVCAGRKASRVQVLVKKSDLNAPIVTSPI